MDRRAQAGNGFKKNHMQRIIDEQKERMTLQAEDHANQRARLEDVLFFEEDTADALYEIPHEIFDAYADTYADFS